MVHWLECRPRRWAHGCRCSLAHLSSGLAAAGGLGLFDRAEPARALADLHLDLGVPAAGGLVKDALAGASDVALDGAVGRWRVRAGSRRQQDGIGIFRRLGRAENGGLLVADPPDPRRDERALPHPGFCLTRGFFVRFVVFGKSHIGQRPAARYQPFLDVFAIDLATRDRAAAAIGRAGMAGPALVAGALDQFVARRNPAGPALAMGVEAELVRRRRVDATEPDAGIADHDLVGLADFRNA